MSRFVAILTMALTGIATTYAGSLGINPGNVLNPDGTVSIGLLPNTGIPNGTPLTANPDGITGSGFAQRNYFGSAVVLNGAQVNPLLPGHATACAANCQNTIYAPGSVPEFNLLGDNVFADKANNSNFWYSVSAGTGAGASTITIPIGIFGVNTISTMLNTAGGVTTGGTIGGNANAYASISFQFNATDATGLTGTNVFETFALLNGTTQRNILDGLGGYASTISSSYTATDMGTAAGTNYTVKTGNDWIGTVNSAGTGVPINSTMVLDYQMFPVLNAYRSDFLVAVIVTDTGTGSGVNFSHEILSGITVTTPEPSTVLMVLSGFGAIGLARLRRRRS